MIGMLALAFAFLKEQLLTKGVYHYLIQSCVIGYYNLSNLSCKSNYYRIYRLTSTFFRLQIMLDYTICLELSIVGKGHLPWGQMSIQRVRQDLPLAFSPYSCYFTVSGCKYDKLVHTCIAALLIQAMTSLQRGIQLRSKSQ